MIVIGVDPHKRTHTAAAVDRRTGELLGELTVKAAEEGHARLLEWARELDSERSFALEDCRQVSCRLERFGRKPAAPRRESVGISVSGLASRAGGVRRGR